MNPLKRHCIPSIIKRSTISDYMVGIKMLYLDLARLQVRVWVWVVPPSSCLAGCGSEPVLGTVGVWIDKLPLGPWSHVWAGSRAVRAPDMERQLTESCHGGILTGWKHVGGRRDGVVQGWGISSADECCCSGILACKTCRRDIVMA